MKSAVLPPAPAGARACPLDEQMASSADRSPRLDQASRQWPSSASYTDSYDRVQLALAQVKVLEGQVTRAKDELDTAKKRADADTSSRRRADNQELMASMRTFRDSLVADEKAARAAVRQLPRAAISRAGSADPAKPTPCRETALRAPTSRGSGRGAARNARVAADFYRNADPRRPWASPSSPRSRP
jgi:hypothetical protein